MENNIIQHATGTIIINGGNGLKDCPESWDEAYALEVKMNEGKEENAEPIWDFDCGFKLDFDGPLVSVSSRFYPPKTHYGNTWDGTVSIVIGSGDIIEKKFNCETLEELRSQVEIYVNGIASKLKSALVDIASKGDNR